MGGRFWPKAAIEISDFDGFEYLLLPKSGHSKTRRGRTTTNDRFPPGSGHWSTIAANDR